MAAVSCNIGHSKHILTRLWPCSKTCLAIWKFREAMQKIAMRQEKTNFGDICDLYVVLVDAMKITKVFTIVKPFIWSMWRKLSRVYKPPHPFYKLPPTPTHLKKILFTLGGGWEWVGGSKWESFSKIHYLFTDLWLMMFLHVQIVGGNAEYMGGRE